MTLAQTHLMKEGTTELFVYDTTVSEKGPGVRQGLPFYNPAMELNRDLSILVNQWLINTSARRVHLLDGLAASGIKGIRYAHELIGEFDVTLNDWDEASYALIQQNIEKYGFQNVTACQKDLNVLLAERRYHSIDIDPFGSPISFLDAAVRSVYNQGLISCTATDTAALCGVYPRVCYRRYGAWPLHVPCMHEIGLRILVGVVCREAAKYDRGIVPLLCYATDHYLRIYLQITKGKAAANDSMAQYQSISSDDIPLSQGPPRPVGPLWLGKLQNASLLQELRKILVTKQLGTVPQLRTLLLRLEDEAEGPPLFYTTADVSSLLKVSPPPLDHLFVSLRTQGYQVTRTHCTPTGFKTNAPLSVIKDIFK